MKYLKLFENFDEPEEDDIIFSAETQRSKYKIIIYQTEYDKEHGSYSIKETTGRKNSGGGNRQNKLDMEAWLNNEIDGSAKIDDINYTVKINKHDFRILAVNKEEPPRTERYFKQLLQGMGEVPEVPEVPEVVVDVPISTEPKQMINPDPMAPIQ